MKNREKFWGIYTLTIFLSAPNAQCPRCLVNATKLQSSGYNTITSSSHAHVHEPVPELDTELEPGPEPEPTQPSLVPSS